VDWEDPNKSTRTSARNLDRDPIRELHQGQRPYAPHQRAGHMTHPNRSPQRSSNPLQAGAIHMNYAGEKRSERTGRAMQVAGEHAPGMTLG
jgi:hypothetical protein